MVVDALSRADFESAYLAPYAMRTVDSAGRQYPETEHPYRGAFQRDRDRIVHAAAFRRLSGKTQVFTGSMGDYHRTRLTHTMEVASIARTIGRTLRLNEDLIEALALLHDIGHPPFGHAGEDALHDCLALDGGFSHNQFALTLVRDLERPYPHYRGLNLTAEVLASQEFRAAKHRARAGQCPLLEAQVVDAADSMAYDAHDIDDAVKLDLLTLEELLELPLVAECHRRVADRFGRLEGKMLRRTLVHELIDLQVSDLLQHSATAIDAAQFHCAADVLRGPICICSSEKIGEQKRELERYLFQRVYRHPAVVTGRSEAQRKLRDLFKFLCEDVSRLPIKFRQRAAEVGIRPAVGDYLGGMTDHFCLRQFEQLP